VRYISPSQVPPDSPESAGKKSIVFTYSKVGMSQANSQIKTKEEIKSPKKSLAGSGAGNSPSSNKKNDNKSIDLIPLIKKIESNLQGSSSKQIRTEEIKPKM
jgi:hypothetical protein